MTVDDFISEWHNEASFVTAVTSGSTGTPRQIRLDKEFMRASARRTNAFFSINSEARLHLPLSADYIAGKMMIIRALEANATLTCEPPSNTPSLAPQGYIDLLAVVPSQMEYLLAKENTSVHNYLIGGSAISPALRHQIAASGIAAWESYGMTETASHIAIRPVAATPEPFATLSGIYCSLGEDNNLIITMPRNTRNDATITITTRDVAHLIDPEHFLILGRLDNAIITGGIKVHPEQVEAKLAALHWPFRYYIGGVPDHKWTHKVVLYIDTSSIPAAVPNPAFATAPDAVSPFVTNADLYSDRNLFEAMRTVLRGAELPRSIIRMRTFRYTATGKLLRCRP